jgi:hypothetical protein
MQLVIGNGDSQALLMGMGIDTPVTIGAPNMIKKKQTTSGHSSLKAKPAEAKHQRTSNTGKSAEHQSQETTMTHASSGSPAPSDSRAAGSKAVSTKGDLKQKFPHTHKVEFLGVGKDENADRYLRWRVGDFVAVVSVASLIREPSDTYVRLQRAGVILAERAGQQEFIGRVTAEASKDATFDVATRPGLLKGEFYFPDGSSSKGSTGAFYPDEQHLQTYRKFHRAGTRAGWGQVVALAQGNTRMILGLALACTGPICGEFNLDPPGIQFVGEGGVGKTPLARIIAAIWGWDASGSTRLGFGTSWKMKPGGLEVIMEAYNHTLVFLDEMSKATELQVEFVMTIAQGQGTARMTERGRRIWCMPILSTSNRSFVRIMEKLGLEFDPAYVDRLMDLPAPTRTCILENLHGHPDVAAFFAYACQLAEAHHGWAGYSFGTKFAAALRSNREELRQDIEAARQDYLQAAAGITSSWRNLVRVHGRFATIYASACLAIRFDVLPLTKQELLAALLTCECDHVAFIDAEVRRLRVPVTNPDVQLLNPAPVATGTVAAANRTPLVRLEQYLLAKIPNGLIDLRNSATELPADHDHDDSPGYIGIHDGTVELWLSNVQFEKIAGGKRDARAVKQTLVPTGVIKIWGRGKGRFGPLVKRRIANLGLCWVVAMTPSKKMKAKLPALRGR